MIVKDELAAMPPRHRCHPSSQYGHQKPDREHCAFGRANADDPVRAENGKQHHCQNEMAPTRGAIADAAHQQQLRGAGYARRDTHEERAERGISCGAGPEIVARPEEQNVGPKNTHCHGNGKGHQHGVQRVARNSNARFRLVQSAMLLNWIAELFFKIVHGAPLSDRMMSILKRIGALSVPLFAAQACTAPLSTLDPAGPSAEAISWLWWVFLAGAAGLTVFVMALLALSFGRPRAVSERRWTWGLGVWFSLAILSGMLVAGVAVGERLVPRDAAIEVHAHAQQWSWTFTHPGPDGAMVEAGRDLHIPAGQPVDVRITSADVIHSFWVPRLAGKMDAIPGRENVLRIQAASPGIYEGRCAEFCGIGYATHRFRVIAHDPAEWPADVPAPAEEASE